MGWKDTVTELWIKKQSKTNRTETKPNQSKPNKKNPTPKYKNTFAALGFLHVLITCSGVIKGGVLLLSISLQKCSCLTFCF